MTSLPPFPAAEPPPRTGEETRVLVHAPSANDASITVETLRRAGFAAGACAGIDALGAEIARGCALVVIAEEALSGGASSLAEILAGQPAWSDLPIAIVTSDAEFAHRKRPFESFINSGNIIEIERPFRPETLLSSVRVALRARLRQYEMRDLLARLRSGEERVRQILESIDDAFISIDSDWIICFVNPAYMRLVAPLHPSPEALIGHSLWEKFPGLDQSPPGDFYRRVMREQTARTMELYYEPLKVWLEIRAFPSPRILSLYVRDITSRRAAENALHDAKESAEAANQAKDYFLAVLSHELRTPLNPVLMIASAREADQSLPPRVRAEMAMISRNIQLETKLIDDLLDLSRITSGKVHLNLRPVALNPAVTEVCDTCKSQAIDGGVELVLSLAPDVGRVPADAARLQQILWNILKNAIKFTPAGGQVFVTTRRLSPTRVEVEIRDKGMGIDAKLLPRIFDAFEQGEVRKTQQFGGLGLGLAITKALVDLHDGRIFAESDGPGLGSTFRVQLPVSRAGISPPDQEPPPAPSAPGPLGILLVEDHVDTASILQSLLESFGYTVRTAHTARAALELAREQPFDLLVSDVGLPDLPGYELVRELRKTRQFHAIAMSGYGMEEDIRKSREAGFAEHLVKPVTFDQLRQSIERLARSI